MHYFYGMQRNKILIIDYRTATLELATYNANKFLLRISAGS